MERDAGHIRIFGGGGGTILPDEGEELARYGVTRVYSPDDGREMGMQGMVNDMLARSDFATGELGADFDFDHLDAGNTRMVATLISAAENFPDKYQDVFEQIESRAAASSAPVVGVTGTGGSGKSSLVDELLRRLLLDFDDLRIAVVSVDPSKRRSGGALLGDRIRMNSIPHPRAYMRSLATRQANLALSPHVQRAIEVVKAAGFDLVILETSGIGQSDTEIVDYSDMSIYVMTPEYGAATQLEKIDMLDFADLVAINKADKQGAHDALRDVRKQYKRNRLAFSADDDELPVHLTVASDFNDPGTNRFYRAFLGDLAGHGLSLSSRGWTFPSSDEAKQHVVPPERTRYLAEIVEAIRGYDAWADRAVGDRRHLYRLEGARETVAPTLVTHLRDGRARMLDPENRRALEHWEAMVAEYAGEEFVYHVRGREIGVPLHEETLSHTRGPEGGSAPLPVLGRSASLAAPGERPRGVPVYRRGVPVQAGRGGPGPDVRRGGPAGADQPPIPLPGRGDAGEAALHRVRLGDPLRRGPPRAARHLRQGGQLGGVDRHRRRRQEAVLRVRPHPTRPRRCR